MEKMGASPSTAPEKKAANTSVEEKKATPSSVKKGTRSSQYDRLEHALLAATDPSQSVVERGQVAAQRFTDLGLGRGVDATRSKPWLEKTSFQVRSLRLDKLIGTEQGGSVEAYEDVVSSVQSLQVELQHTVAVSSTPVTIGVDADHSRTSTNSRHVVGRRVHNRTISFREEFDEIPFQGGHTQPVTPNATPKDMMEGTLLEKEGLTFEEKLAKWVLERLHRDGESDGPLHEHMRAIRDGASPIVVFEEWFEQVSPNEHADKLKQIYELCHDFVSFFHVTHYVSALELGALEYSVMTEEDYLREVGAAGSFGLEKVVSATLKSKSSYSLQKKRKYSQLKRVGLIKNPEGGEYYVPRGTYAEAVIGVEMKPIQILVRHQYLRRLLRHAVSHYIEEQRDTSVGPFLITSDSINRETVYLRVTENDMSLQATADKKEASKFFVLMTTEDSNADTFHIVYIGGTETANKGLYRQPTLASFSHSQRGRARHQPLHYYLSAPLSIDGTNYGPPHFELNPKKQHTMFVLHSRLRTRGAPAEVLGPWVQGHEGYFINCHARKFARGGYLAVRRVKEGDVVQYRPVCVPSRQSAEDFFKVFSLVRPPMEEQSATVKELKSSPYTSRALGPSKANKTDTEDGTEMQSL